MAKKTTVQTFDDIRALIRKFPGPDDGAAGLAIAREPQLTKPPGSLGRLENIAAWLAAWQGRHPPLMDKPRIHVFAGNHGVTGRGVSAYPPEVTVQMVVNFKDGGAAINQLCRMIGAELCVEELGLDQPTRDFTEGPAMDEDECAEAVAFGMDVVTEDTDVLCLGEMGIGNTTSAAAICHGLYGGEAVDWTGPGTGVSGQALVDKAAVVAEAVFLHRKKMIDGLDVMRCVGGRELAAIAGAVIGARLKQVPVLLDGYVCTAAAAVLAGYGDGMLDHCMVAHVSAEPGHKLLLEKLGMPPLLDLGMRLGEASGAALAVSILRAAAACHTGMATFAEAGVTDIE